ncbi:MAG: hypothetical protein IJA54_03650 [Tyzzerella sp.]|nr:hypothetical protein [Tyzzerella sp.]
MEQTGASFGLDVIIVIVIVFLGCMILARFVNWLLRFQRELKLLRSEIGRTKGREQKYWIKKRRKLWFSLLPFVRY